MRRFKKFAIKTIQTKNREVSYANMKKEIESVIALKAKLKEFVSN